MIPLSISKERKTNKSITHSTCRQNIMANHFDFIFATNAQAGFKETRTLSKEIKLRNKLLFPSRAESIFNFALNNFLILFYFHQKRKFGNLV